MEINIIAAVARNRAIGQDNKLIYWLPNDLKRFKALTTGHTIVMGRKTFDSLPKGALPNRRNVVLTRKAEVGGLKAEGGSLKAEVGEETGPFFYPSLEAALASCKADEEVFVIGGASVYEQAMAVADRLLLTEVDDVPEKADAFFPDYSEGWRETKREAHPKDERHAFEYAFVDYERVK